MKLGSTIIHLNKTEAVTIPYAKKVVLIFGDSKHF